MITTERGQRVLLFLSWRQHGRRADGIHTFTVGELMEYLREFDEDMPVIIEGYDGYQYCGVDYDSVHTEVIE